MHSNQILKKALAVGRNVWSLTKELCPKREQGSFQFSVMKYVTFFTQENHS